MALDRFGRNIHYLRISLTDRCNLRCLYCMPEVMCFKPHADLLQDDELLELVNLFAEMGIDKIRLTGGEPTIRADIVDLVREIARTPGINSLSMTTNGVLFSKLAEKLVKAGLQRVNFSLDTLDPVKYTHLTRWGVLQDVWDGIKAAEDVGLIPIKINSVLLNELTSDDIVDLARLTLDHPWQIRFIERMPLGPLTDFQHFPLLDVTQAKCWIESALGPLEIVNDGLLDGEAQLFRLPKSKGIIGFITTFSQPFCSVCTRVRLTADGKLRLCLLNEKEINLASPLRAGFSKVELRRIILEGIWQKPWGHELAQGIFPANRLMCEIGG